MIVGCRSGTLLTGMGGAGRARRGAEDRGNPSGMGCGRRDGVRFSLIGDVSLFAIEFVRVGCDLLWYPTLRKAGV